MKQLLDLFVGSIIYLMVVSCQFQKPEPKPLPDAGTGGTSDIGGRTSTGGSSTIDPRPSTGGSSQLDDCASAELTICGLKCPECKSPKGTPFSEICRRAESDGRSFCPASIATIKSCQDFNAASKACRSR